MWFLKDDNASTDRIAFYASSIIAITSAIISLIWEANYRNSLFIFIVTFIVCYYILRNLLFQFIKQKIDIIFKLISKTKATKREEFYQQKLLPQRTLAEVQKEVEEWAAKDTEKVIELQKTEKYRREFLQNLSHELKTPFFTLQGFLEILHENKNLTEEQKEKFWDNANSSLKRLSILINDISQITRLETGELRINKQKFDIVKLCKEIADIFSLTAKEKNIRIFLTETNRINTNVWADEEKIKQVVSNLVENAIKYGKQDGFVRISFTAIVGEQILIEVTDDGIGIPEHQIDRVFERFFRTDKAKDYQKEGSGLGLAICKHIIEAHGSRLHVRSNETVGTTVGFVLNSAR